MAETCAARYRARNPRATPLYRLFEAHFDEVRGQWEERFERRCGFWRGFVDEQVRRYLDCGLYENGFARIRCPDCAEEYLLAFSCKTRELCPSCGSEMKVIAFIIEHDVVDAIPVLTLSGRLGAAAWFVGIVLLEVLVLAVTRWTCPLTPVGARFTDDRRDNFDIFLPEWLARHNKTVFGGLYLAGVALLLAAWIARG